MSRARYGGDHKILLPLYRGDRKIPYPFDKGDLKFNETNFARFFRPPPPIVNELPLSKVYWSHMLVIFGHFGLNFEGLKEPFLAHLKPL